MFVAAYTKAPLWGRGAWTLDVDHGGPKFNEALSRYRRLRRTLETLLERGEDYDAARAFLAWVSLCHAHRWRRAYSRFEGPLRALRSSPTLSRRTRTVIEFAAHVVRVWGDRQHASEVVRNAQHYLSARPTAPPGMQFFPTLGEPLIHLEWNQLDEELRRSICREVGASQSLAAFPAEQLDPAVRDWLSWGYEVVRRVRITFLAA